MSRLDQRRAAFALKKVQSISTNKAKYKTQLLKLPARLHTNGLAQTVAFYLSAGPDSPEAEICSWLEEWLRTDDLEIYPTSASLIHCITNQGEFLNAPLDLYRQASTEARSLSTWLKRFAEAFIPAEAEDAA
jgi:CRISPR type III-B/RAMP module-associated protein Cmr5